MIDLSVKDLVKSFDADTNLLDGVSFDIQAGERVGLLGRNGAGKTTLFKILTGELDYNTGEVRFAPGRKVGLISQIPHYPAGYTVEDVLRTAFRELANIQSKMRRLEEQMAAQPDKALLAEYDALSTRFQTGGGYETDMQTDKICNGLGIPAAQRQQDFDSLSGGEKTRVNLARLLLEKTDILLLDEPTNHLDLPTIEWLENYLKGYDKAVVIVSHDRMFLDKVADVTYEIEYHEMKRYPGNYTYFMQRKQEDLIKQEKDYEEQQKEIKRLTDWIEKWKNTPTKVAATRSKRMAIEHMVKIEKPRRFDTRAFHGRYTPRIESYTNVIQAKDLSIGYDAPLAEVSFLLQKKERLAIIGENGKGKSTLLKTLIGELPALGGSFKFGQNVEWGYFDQQKAVMEQAPPKQTVLENFWAAYPEYLREEVRSALGGFLFSGEDVEKKMGQLSGGEKVRLALCKMLQTRPNLLILDEPTNHMDIIGKEALEQMLREYEGTVLFVSHDRYFISRIATGILEFSGDAVRQYAMNYEEYLAEKQKCAGGVAANAGSAAGQGADVRGAADAGSVPTLSDVFDKKAYYNPGKVRSRLQRQKEKYERMLAESEEKLAELQMQMLDPALASDYPKLMELQSAVDAEEANQDSLLERMLETETELAEYEEA